jgi:large subunit ribosomal protein L6
MSRIGNTPIAIPEGVKVEQKGQTVKVSGTLGSLEIDCDPSLAVEIDDPAMTIRIVNPDPGSRRSRELHGTTRALIANMVSGVSRGFEKKLEVYGTGYSVKEQGGKLVLSVGFARAVEMPIPKGVKVSIDVAATRGNDIPARLAVSGIDKYDVAQFAANIRRVKPPEPYRGKGIRYADEQVRRKVGKAFASGGA